MSIIYGSLKVFENANPQISQKIRADERAKVLDEVTENIIPTLYEYDVDEQVINECKRLLERMKEVQHE